MTELTLERCLVIPDVHQDIEWVERIFAREKDWDHCVFLGDYLDPKGKPAEELAGVRATARYFRELVEEHGDRITLLWGNHDIPYWEMKKRMRTGNLDELFYYAGVRIAKSRVHNIFREWSDEFVGCLKLFVWVNGRLLSHAGLAQPYWPESDSIGQSLDLLVEQGKTALLGVHRQRHPLLSPGQSRGGWQDYGGITWQCWIADFCDQLPLPQVVGHTAAEKVRQKNRSSLRLSAIRLLRKCGRRIEATASTAHNLPMRSLNVGRFGSRRPDVENIQQLSKNSPW